MSSDKKPSGIFKLLNLFDIILILVAVALVAVLFFTRSQGSVTPTAESGTVRYTIELTAMQNNSADLISVGDDLVDKVKKYRMGTVVAVEVYPYERQAEDLENGGMVDSPMSTQQAARVTIEASCTQTESQITVDGGYAVRVGTIVNVKGPGYNGLGYVISIERSAAQ